VFTKEQQQAIHCGHNILTEGVFIPQLPSNAVHVTTHCRLMRDVFNFISLNYPNVVILIHVYFTPIFVFVSWGHETKLLA
jgi:hypothetical protein